MVLRSADDPKPTVAAAMAQPKIQLLVFDGCPLAHAARNSLRAALESLGLQGFEEIDIGDANAPAELRRWGSPTILVDAHDVAGNEKGEAIGCRVYDGPDRVPTPGEIASAIRRSMGTSQGPRHD